MGINIILPLIMGIAMTVILGSQVAPSLVENMKIKKVENRTIANQNLIKDAIVKYIKLEGKAPTSLNDLKTLLLMENQHNNNLFNGDYTYELVKLPDGRYNGTLKIFTTINDESATKYFSNNFKFPNTPICTQSGLNHNCETFYQLDMEVFDIFAKIEKEKEKQILLDIYNNVGSTFLIIGNYATYTGEPKYYYDYYTPEIKIKKGDINFNINLLKKAFPINNPSFTLNGNILYFSPNWKILGDKKFPIPGPTPYEETINKLKEYIAKEIGL
ncbi:hypothetical protein [Aliarcobacter cryaerophilus]|uniref:hypothetical protein n=1 Tax=Aliarcobacter cryaerophilus TaxID=28198 RepID=UPI0021B49B9F|nr:hypothetical protein [Aliarcobacter cryaerophilus]MCT7513722.1 hypothetical protein [Aliarcobacter cryaerophilus]